MYVVTYLDRISLKVIFFNGLKDRQPNRAADGTTARGGEEGTLKTPPNYICFDMIASILYHKL